ncbi:biotin/lipoyl-containing protein, partial [Acinetobacter baumannii]
IESMKMEHLVTAQQGGKITRIVAADGVTLMQGETILYIEPQEMVGQELVEEAEIDLDFIRPDLAEMIARQGNTLDENRPQSVERRRKTNQRT